MNAVGDEHDRVDPVEWERPDMRAALARRDITVVYRLLQRLGFSQQKIAALTGQSQPEVSAIIHGRKIMAYDVLSRIADGLGIPRGYMGLSYAVEAVELSQDSPTGTAPTAASTVSNGVVVRGVGGGARSNGSNGAKRVDEGEEDDPVLRRDFLGAAAAVAMGGHAPGIEQWLPRTAGLLPPTPVRIGAADIQQIRATTRQLTGLDRQLGGGAVVDAVTGYLRWVSALPRARCSDDIGRQLRVALADLYNVAGLSLHDAGRHREANRYFMHGLVLARDAEDREMAANLLWAMGRVNLNQEHVTDALRFFQLAQMAAQDVGSHAELARLHANEAWAYALLGEPQLVADALGRADHEYGQAVAAQQPLPFHGAAWYLALQSDDPLNYFAAAHGILARSDDRSATRSALLTIDAATRLLAADSLPGRLRAQRQIALAGALLHAGEREIGLTAAHQAVDQVTALRSASTAERLRHLAQAAKAWPRQRDALDLRRRIAAVQVGRLDVPLTGRRDPAARRRRPTQAQ